MLARYRCDPIFFNSSVAPITSVASATLIISCNPELFVRHVKPNLPILGETGTTKIARWPGIKFDVVEDSHLYSSPFKMLARRMRISGMLTTNKTRSTERMNRFVITQPFLGSSRVLFGVLLTPLSLYRETFVGSYTTLRA